MRAGPQASPDDIDITSLWTAVRSNLPRLLVASLLTGAATYGVLSLMAPRYAAETQLAIVAKGSPADPNRDPRRDGAGDSIAVRMDREAVNTHIQAIRSTDVADKVIAALKLEEKPEFNSAVGSPDTLSALLRKVGIGAPKKTERDIDRALNVYAKQLEVYSPKESRSISIKFTSIDPALASAIANKIADVYRESLANQSVVESDDVKEDLARKISALKAEATAADAEVEKFKSEADILRAGGQAGSLNEQQLTELTAEVNRAKAARSEAEARARSAREMMKAGSAEVSPDVQKSPHIQGLVQQRVRLEREIAEASASLLPGHPRMRQLSAELSGLKKQIASEVAKVVDGLEKEAKIAAFTEEAKTKSLDEAKSRVKTSAPDEAKLRSLETAASAKNDELRALQAKYEAARVLSETKAIPVEAKVIMQARASTIPVFPKKTPFALLAALSIFFLGLALTITKALIRGARQPVTPALKPAAAAQPASPIRPEPVLAVVPRAAPAPTSTATPAKAEAVTDERVLRMSQVKKVAEHLQIHVPSAGGCRTLVVGETSGIDAGPEATALAMELSAEGHSVIIVDWSPDGSGLAQKLGFARTPGMTELLSGAAKFEDVVQRLPESEAHVIASGAAQPYDSEGPNPDQLNLILDALDEAYAHIIVVGPHDAARELFEAIEGRFDAGITVFDGRRRVSVIQDPPGTFLGYEVADIELIRLERKDSAGQKIVRGAAAGAAEFQPAR